MLNHKSSFAEWVDEVDFSTKEYNSEKISVEKYQKILKLCCEVFILDEEWKRDDTYFDIWMKYAATEESFAGKLKVFERMEKYNIGTHKEFFWAAKSVILEELGCLPDSYQSYFNGFEIVCKEGEGNSSLHGSIEKEKAVKRFSKFHSNITKKENIEIIEKDNFEDNNGQTKVGYMKKFFNGRNEEYSFEEIRSIVTTMKKAVQDLEPIEERFEFPNGPTDDSKDDLKDVEMVESFDQSEEGEDYMNMNFPKDVPVGDGTGGKIGGSEVREDFVSNQLNVDEENGGNSDVHIYMENIHQNDTEGRKEKIDDDEEEDDEYEQVVVEDDDEKDSGEMTFHTKEAVNVINSLIKDPLGEEYENDYISNKKKRREYENREELEPDNRKRVKFEVFKDPTLTEIDIKLQPNQNFDVNDLSNVIKMDKENILPNKEEEENEVVQFTSNESGRNSEDITGATSENGEENEERKPFSRLQ